MWAQHAYAERGAVDAGREGAGRPAASARSTGAPCTRGKPIWVTETGVGGARVGAERDAQPGASCAPTAARCAAQLRRWHRDPRVDAAFQYTFREDIAFPVGLADAGLTRAYPVYDLWSVGRRPERAAYALSRA